MRTMAPLATLAAALCLALPASAADAPAVSTTTLALVDYALRTPLPDMDPKLASYFLDVDPQSLPAKKRDRAFARQLEIRQALKAEQGRKKGNLRFVGVAACEPKPYPLRVILMVGHMVEVPEDDIEFAEARTKCTEDDLQCEFSLMINKTERPGKPPKKRYFLKDIDPINGIIAEHHGKAGGGSNFFGAIPPTCQR